MKRIDYSIYLVTNPGSEGEEKYLNFLYKALKGGVTLLQYRHPGASTRQLFNLGIKISELCDEFGIPLIVNNRVDIALAINASGVHLGEEDLSILQARKIMGRQKLIGATAHSIEQALKAEEQGADYLGFGSIFPSKTKKIGSIAGTELLWKVTGLIKIPVVGIGGITAENMASVIEAGASGVAVIGDLHAKDPVSRLGHYKYILSRIRCENKKTM